MFHFALCFLVPFFRFRTSDRKLIKKQYEAYFVKSSGWYENDKSIFIAMEYFPLGDLKDYILSPLSENEAQQITTQILEGLFFMHDNWIAHRDLKPTVSLPSNL